VVAVAREQVVLVAAELLPEAVAQLVHLLPGQVRAPHGDALSETHWIKGASNRGGKDQTDVHPIANTQSGTSETAPVGQTRCASDEETRCERLESTDPANCLRRQRDSLAHLVARSNGISTAYNRKQAILYTATIHGDKTIRALAAS